MNFETIAITAVVGLLVGWVTGFVMKSGGYGTVADTSLGVLGGVAGGLVVWIQGLVSAGNWLAMMAAAFVGAFILVVVQRKFWNLKTTATA